MFWESLAVALVAATLIGGATTAVNRFLRRNREKRIVQYLQAHTEDRAGKQYISIISVAQAICLDVTATTEAVDRSPEIFRCKTDESMIGLYEEERSVYEERGILTV